MGGKTDQLKLELADLPPFGEEEGTEAAALVWEALGRLQGSDPRAAIWRLVDAAGLLSEQFPEDPTVHAGTDRGYQVVRTGHGRAISADWYRPSPQPTPLPELGQHHCAGGPAA